MGEEKEGSLKWYDKFKLPPPDFKCPKLSSEEVTALRDEAEFILRDEEVRYRTKTSGKKNTEEEWLKMMASKGTYSDQVAARIVIVQQSPVHNINSLSFLISKVKASKKKECVLVIKNLTELFITELLRPGKKLKTFENQPLGGLSELCSGNALTRKLQLLHWLFEDKLKSMYREFVSALESIAHDTVEQFREKAIYSMSKLLIKNPELEEVLLKNLVNKIGDPTPRIVNFTVSCLSRLLATHPNMKTVVVKEIEKLLFRPNCSPKCKFYCISFLCRLKFTESDMELAKKLILLYFAFFKACIKEGDVESRLLASLINGVHKAYYFASLVNPKENVIPDEHIEVMYKIVYVGAFNVGIQALLLLQKVDHSDRFYSALYRKMLDHRLPQTSHPALFINLIYKSINKDRNFDRIRAFLKRLFHLCLYSPVPLACGILYSISQLQSNHAFKIGRLVEENFDDVDKFKDDGSTEEIYKDIKSEDEDETNQGQTTKSTKSKSNEANNTITSSWNHCLNTVEQKVHFHAKYDPLQRNPAYAGGERAVFRELFMLTKHFHPTVALYAKNIVEGVPNTYQGDPLNDFTLSRFLERFSFKNPKAQLIRKPSGAITKKTPEGAKGMQVNTNQYLNLSEEKIPVDELFLYRYLKEKRDTTGTKMNDDEPDDSADEEVTDGEFLDLLDKMTGKSDVLDFEDDILDTKRAKKLNKDKGDENGDESDENDENVEEDFSEEGSDDQEEDFDDDDDEDDDSAADEEDEDDNELDVSDLGSDLEGSVDDEEEAMDFDDDDSGSFDGNVSFDDDEIRDVREKIKKLTKKKPSKEHLDTQETKHKKKKQFGEEFEANEKLDKKSKKIKKEIKSEESSDEELDKKSKKIKKEIKSEEASELYDEDIKPEKEKKKKKKKKTSKESDQFYDDLDEMDDLDGMDDFDEDDILTSKKSKKRGYNVSSTSLDDLFAPAAQFSEMLEQTGSAYGKVGSSSQVAVNDHASAKQLAWEAKRNFHMKNGKRKKGASFKKNKKFKKRK
ncbi:unnamed protein product [Bemisia tabaci]|uniref:CCAAT/enhancer-binding protein zeta n=1 Tax=Bemisia tabaci TaxID=7038 RepID=A0A9P0AGA4_BEMTA|nr:unnamed protein product [Bemisia tabaci]